MLADLLSGFSSDEITAADLDAKDLQELYAREPDATEDHFDIEASLEKHAEPATKPGDMILLGSHRLLCGDATLAEDADRLFDGVQADMVFTDPPYNVDYHGKTADQLSIENDCMDGYQGWFFDSLGIIDAVMNNVARALDEGFPAKNTAPQAEP